MQGLEPSRIPSSFFETKEIRHYVYICRLPNWINAEVPVPLPYAHWCSPVHTSARVELCSSWVKFSPLAMFVLTSSMTCCGDSRELPSAFQLCLHCGILSAAWPQAPREAVGRLASDCDHYCDDSQGKKVLPSFVYFQYLFICHCGVH